MLIVMIQFDHRTILGNYDGSDINVIITFPSISPVDNLFVNILIVRVLKSKQSADGNVNVFKATNFKIRENLREIGRWEM